MPVLVDEVHGLWWDDVPPRPTPFPLPSWPRTLGLCPCPGWGWVGARAGLVLGMITPPSTPLPSALFFSGRAKGRGVEGGPTIPWSSPPPPPTSPPQGPIRSWRDWNPGVEGGGGGAGTGTHAHPTTQLTLGTPITPPPPPEPPPELWASDLSPQGWLDSVHRKWFRVGAGAWGVQSSINPTIPPSLPGAPPPPSDVRAVGQRSLGRRGIWWG